MKVSLPKPPPAFCNLHILRYLASWAPVAMGWFLWFGCPLLAAYVLYVIVSALAG